MKVKIKKLNENAVIPKYAKLGDAAMDLYATKVSQDSAENYVYGTGLAMEIPKGYVGLIFPRSSISKTSHTLRNSVGVIDSGYRGEIMLKFFGLPRDAEFENSELLVYHPGDRIGQIMIIPHPEVEFVEVDDLSESDRGDGGFGSTGR